jgi:hypothetical protein
MGLLCTKQSFTERHFCTSRNRVRPSRCAKSLQPPFKTLSHTQELLALRRPTEQRNIASCSRVIETASSTVGINMHSQHYTNCSRRDAEYMRGRTYSQSLGLCDGCLGSVGTTLKSSGYRLQDSSYCMTGFFFLGDVLCCSFYTFRHDRFEQRRPLHLSILFSTNFCKDSAKNYSRAYNIITMLDVQFSSRRRAFFSCLDLPSRSR